MTVPARTIVDLAWTNEDREHVLDALDDARARGLATTEDVLAAYRRRRRRGSRKSADWLLEHLALDA